MDCNAATIVHLPDFEQLTVANLVNLLLMEEPPLGYVRFTLEQMELFQCLDIKLTGVTEIPGDVEIKKVEPKDKKRATRSGTNVVQAPDKVSTQPGKGIPGDVDVKKIQENRRMTRSGASVDKSTEKVSTMPPEAETEGPANYMCDLCDSATSDIQQHLESEHEEIMPIPVGEISTFFKVIPVKKINNDKERGASESLPCTTNELKCPSCPKTYLGNSMSNLRDNLKNHIAAVHYGEELMLEAARYYIGNKCKECGHVGKSNALKKKHMLYNHTKYVERISSEVERAEKRKEGISEKDRNNVPRDELIQKGNNVQLEEISFQEADLVKETSNKKRRREEEDDSEPSKSLKVAAQLKLVDLKQLTEPPLAEVEDLLRSDDEDGGAEEVTLNELCDETVGDRSLDKEQSSEVLSIQDQLLQMQDLSSEEDEDEDANNRLNEFVGEDLSEVEYEDLANEKDDDETMAINRNGDYDKDVGCLVSDEDIADDISDEVSERLLREQAACDFEDDEQTSLDKATVNTNEGSVGDLGNISDDEEDSLEEDEDAEEDNLEEVLNFQNGEGDEEDDDDDAETAPNSEREDESQMCKDSKSVLSTEILEKLDNLLNS